ncbi:phosphatidylserine/phosphatidylglycerophosphate/cardiolipin synthase family protein [Arenimonas sp.]|jgi:putative cardiolipin synthase|uniref:phosphatidylserine/phosphatidylglycerophosphate/ cardiolipin synthase family protein n=1 Tax=Arenimonas sp. TaxID=1872635 RepID=UPI0037BE2EC2
MITRLAAAVVLLALGACANLPESKHREAGAFAGSLQGTANACQVASGCGLDSPLRDLADTTAAGGGGKHEVILLDQGNDALLTRLHMIESARHSIELQVFIYDLDESGTLMLDAMVRAAQRGVKVRLLLDQLYGLSRPQLQAKLSALHRNFELRLYSPMFNQAKTDKAEFFAGILFRFQSLNQRMHTKLLLVDDRMAVVGGRNIQDRYFDWGASYNYRDRDLWVAGPSVLGMRDNFNAFWDSERSVPAPKLDDVARVLLDAQADPKRLQMPKRDYSARMNVMAAMAQDGPRLMTTLAPYRRAVGNAVFYADLPEKHADEASSRARASNAVYQIISQAQDNVLLQTPYLVMSRLARQTFRGLQRRDRPVQVWVSTNSLAATDAFPVYALSHKYKRLYLRELGFRIHEFKPFPVSAYMRVGREPGWLDKEETEAGEAPGLFGYTGSGMQSPVPLSKEGQRAGLHAKSMVIDDRIAVIGSHNFDPRSDDYNTESMLLIEDPEFAALLSGSIRNDMLPENAWSVAPRETLPALADFNYTMGKVSEQMPVFDVWPWPYATSYQVRTDCGLLDYTSPKFAECSEAVGDFPEVNMSLKGIYTRIITVFGAGLEPIL